MWKVRHWSENEILKKGYGLRGAWNLPDIQTKLLLGCSRHLMQCCINWDSRTNLEKSLSFCLVVMFGDSVSSNIDLLSVFWFGKPFIFKLKFAKEVCQRSLWIKNRTDQTVSAKYFAPKRRYNVLFVCLSIHACEQLGYVASNVEMWYIGGFPQRWSKC